MAEPQKASGFPEARSANSDPRNGTPEPRNGSVPQPRDPAERSVVGTARAVSASASVPMASRVAPPGAEEVPQSSPPQSRVYGRAAAPVVADPEPGRRADDPAAGDPYPNSGAPAATGRASASARVAPPTAEPGHAGPIGAPGASPYTELTTDVAGRGRASQPDSVPEGFGGQPGDRFGRPTDDPHAYGRPFPPAAPPRPDNPAQGRAGMGAFPLPANRPGTDETANWPGARVGDGPNWPTSGAATESPNWPTSGGAAERPNWPVSGGSPEDRNWPAPDQEADPDQSRFDQFSAQPPAGATAVSTKPETPHVRMIPILLGVVIAAALLVGLAIGIVWLISRGSDSSGFSVSAGDCVRRSGNEAIKANCGEPGSFQVVSIADSKDKCADSKQPYVVNPTKDGKSQILCLKPSS